MEDNPIHIHRSMVRITCTCPQCTGQNLYKIQHTNATIPRAVVRLHSPGGTPCN